MPEIATPIDPSTLDQAARVIKCLGHPLRLRLLDAMEGPGATVTDLQIRTSTSQAAVSRQLAILRGHGVVAAHRDGPFVRYSITEPKVHHILSCLRGCGA